MFPLCVTRVCYGQFGDAQGKAPTHVRCNLQGHRPQNGPTLALFLSVSIIGPPIRRSLGVSVRRYVHQSIRWSIGLSVRRWLRASGDWSVAWSVCRPQCVSVGHRSVGVLDAESKGIVLKMSLPSSMSLCLSLLVGRFLLVDRVVLRCRKASASSRFQLRGVCVSVGLSVCPSVSLSVCQSVSLSGCQSVSLSVCRSAMLPQGYPLQDPSASILHLASLHPPSSPAILRLAIRPPSILQLPSVHPPPAILQQP